MSTYFIEIFSEKKLAVQAQIPKFVQGLDPRSTLKDAKKNGK